MLPPRSGDCPIVALVLVSSPAFACLKASYLLLCSRESIISVFSDLSFPVIRPLSSINLYSAAILRRQVKLNPTYSRQRKIWRSSVRLDSVKVNVPSFTPIPGHVSATSSLGTLCMQIPRYASFTFRPDPDIPFLGHGRQIRRLNGLLPLSCFLMGVCHNIKRLEVGG